MPDPVVCIMMLANKARGNNIGIRFCLSHSGRGYVPILNNETAAAPAFLSRLVYAGKAVLPGGRGKSQSLSLWPPSLLQTAGTAMGMRKGGRPPAA